MKTSRMVLLGLMVSLMFMIGCGDSGTPKLSPTPSSGVPTGVSAEAENSQVTLSWIAVSGATSYNIYWSTTSGVTKSIGPKIANVTTPYAHTGLTNGTTYYYIVTAVTSGGESSESAQVQATPSTNPMPAPTITDFTPTSGAVGDKVTITGTNFDTTAANNTVKFNGTSATVTSATATQIITTVPIGATTGVITVVTQGGTVTSVSLFAVATSIGTQTNNPGTNLMGGSIQGKQLINVSTVTTFAGGAGSPSSSGVSDGTGTSASFALPSGITTDGTNLYVTDGMGNIRKIVISTGVVTTLAGSRSGIPGSADGTGTAARFNYPSGITTDGTNLYVADSLNHTIRKVVISTGAVTTLAGSAGISGSADGTGTAARFNYSNDITTDGTYLYVADRNNHTIRKVVISTGVVTTLAGSAGVSGSADDTGTAARFNYPSAITTDGTSLYVADDSNYTIRKIIISTGAVTTLAGSAGVQGSADGIGAAASFSYYVESIATDGTNLYVTDSNSNTIRKIVISTGAVTTLAGSAGVSGSTDGTGSAARFNYPRGITTDGTDLYVADYSTIRRISSNAAGSDGTPSAPTSVAATAGNNQVAISWSSVAEATSYNVYRSTTYGVTKSSTLVATNVTGTSYEDITAVNGIKYYYAVTALNSVGESGLSYEVNATPMAALLMITSFAPISGVVGTTVTITGTNFSTTPANNTVKFNGTQATVASSTATQIVTTVPTGATTGVITVTTAGGTATSSSSFTVTTGATPTLGAVTKIAAGNAHSIALKGDGTVWAWGDNHSYQLGTSGIFTSPTPVHVSGLTGAIAIDAGNSFNLALKNDGIVWAWGDNFYGQLGDGTNSNSRYTPVQAVGLTGVTVIEAGQYYSFALKNDGTVWAWGSNNSGQLGDGTTTNRYTPVQVSGLTGVTSIKGGFFHTIALKSDGTVWAWGSNGYGELGIDTYVSSKTPIQVSGLIGVTAIAANKSYSLALKNDGTVWAWGSNGYGELGIGTTSYSSKTPVQVSGLTGIIAISAGGDGGSDFSGAHNYALALKNDGTIWAWGSNKSGKLGDGTTTDRYTPVQVSGMTGVTAISGGWDHSVVLKNDGTVWAWGSNGNGQLGDGTTTDRLTPVKVNGSGGL